ncbi:MAG: AbrB/MazE/SpoVT family DNA-binding domain-containing protein [Nitrososphaerales archaeon]
MKFYQVTRKRQVTIPKTLADKKGIKPGDSVFFEETQDAILLKRGQESSGVDEQALRKLIERFAEDVPSIRKHLKRSEGALNENLSRHLRS